MKQGVIPRKKQTGNVPGDLARAHGLTPCGSSMCSPPGVPDASGQAIGQYINIVKACGNSGSFSH